MIVSWLTLPLFAVSVFARPVAFPGNFTLTQTLTSQSLSLPEESLLNCESLHTPTMTTNLLNVVKQIKAQDLHVDLLIGSGGVLEFAGLVQVTGAITEETVPTPAPSVAVSEPPTAPSAFLQKKTPDDQRLHFSSFLSPHGSAYLNDLESELNKVGRTVYSSFLATPQWTLFGVFSEESFSVAQLPPHSKVMLKSTVKFTSPEWDGAALTMFVDGVPVWQETHSWQQPSCAETGQTESADIAVTTPHAKKTLTVKFSSSLANRCEQQIAWELASVLVYFR